METLLKDIGYRICQRRKQLGYTQEQLADKMDVSIQMISNLERGNKAIRIDNLIKISEVLDVGTDYILTGRHSSNELTEKAKALSDRDYALICSMIDYCINNH